MVPILRDIEMCNTSIAISPISLRRVSTLLLVGVAFNSLVYVLLVEDLVGVQDAFLVDILGTLRPTSHNMLHSILDRGQ